MTTDDVQVRQVCWQAAEVIERYGWCKGEMMNPDTGAVCLVGALNEVIFGDPQTMSTMPMHVPASSLALYGKVTEELEHVIAVRWGHGGLADWNDAPSRTSDEVIGLLRRVAGV